MLIELSTLNLWILFEVFLFVFLVLYVLLAILIVRQIYLMNRTLETGIAPYIKFIGWFHLIFSVVVLVFSILLVS